MKIKKIIIKIILLFAVLLCSCKSKNPVKENKEIEEPVFVQKQQNDITWEGLLDSPWPMYQHDPQHTGRSPHIGPQEGIIFWKFDVGGEIFSTPIIDNIGNIYIGSYSMNLFAINSMGQQLWNFPLLGQNYYTTPLIDAKHNLYVSPNGSSLLYSISTSKTLGWSIDMEGFDFKSFNISKDGSVLYTIAFSEEIPNQEVGHLFALSTNDGQVLWKFANIEKQGLYGEPAIGPDQTIYCTSYIGNKIFAINPDGTAKWTFTISATQGGYLSTSSPSVDSDGNIYFNHLNFITCLNNNGREIWHLKKLDNDAWLHTPTIGADGTVYSFELFQGRINLVAIDASGQLKWRTDPEESIGSIHCSPVVDSEGTVYLGLLPAYHANSINFVAIDKDGDIKYKLALPAHDGQISDISLPPSLSRDGIAYIGIERPMGTFLYAIK